MSNAYKAAVQTGRLPDLGAEALATGFVNGAACALAVERVTVWLASIARAGLAIEEENLRREIRADLADRWLKHGP